MLYVEMIQKTETYLSLSLIERDKICKKFIDCRSCPMKCVNFGFGCGKILTKEQAQQIAENLDKGIYNSWHTERLSRAIKRMTTEVKL